MREHEHNSHCASSFQVLVSDSVQHPFCSVNQPASGGCQILDSCPGKVAKHGEKVYCSLKEWGFLGVAQHLQAPLMDRVSSALACAALRRVKTHEGLEKGFGVYLWTSENNLWSEEAKVLLCRQEWRERALFVVVGIGFFFKGLILSPSLAAALGTIQPIVSKKKKNLPYHI